MGFLIPNATNTTSGNKFASLEQAEPDSIDFSILGRAGSSGVYSGCEVTSNNSVQDVDVTAGIIVLDGTPYPVSADTQLSLPGGVTDFRFDLVIARVTAGVASLFVVMGEDEAVNPTFPPSTEVITVSPDSLLHVNFATDVVLAAIFRDAGNVVTASMVVDKRVSLSSTVKYQGAIVPADNSGRTGDLFFQTPSPSADSVDSGLYVRGSAGKWNQLNKTPEGSVGPYVPIGGTIMWMQGAVPAGYLELDGSIHNVATYPDLGALWGSSFGGNGTTTFGVPDVGDKSLRGGAAGQEGNEVGEDSTSITTSNLPSHTHGIGDHDHPMAHNHSISHSHTGSATSAGSHQHGDGTLSAANGGTHNHPPSGEFTDEGDGHRHGFVATFGENGGVNGGGIQVLGLIDAHETGLGVYPHDDNANHTGPALNLTGTRNILQTGQGAHTHDVAGTTGSAGSHSHAVTVSSSGGTSGASSNPVTGIDSGTTLAAGLSQPLTNIPKSIKMRVIVRAK